MIGRHALAITAGCERERRHGDHGPRVARDASDQRARSISETHAFARIGAKLHALVRTSPIEKRERFGLRHGGEVPHGMAAPSAEEHVGVGRW